MLALIQRVSRAQVRVDGETIGAIDDGLLALVAIESADGEAQAQRMCDRLLGYRVFADANGKMNHSLTDTGGGLLLVSQFTLAADTGKGMRPGFSVAAAPEHGLRYYNRLVEIARERHTGAADRLVGSRLVGSRLVSRSPVGSRLVESGRFGAHMEVELVNDGPVTFLLRA